MQRWLPRVQRWLADVEERGGGIPRGSFTARDGPPSVRPDARKREGGRGGRGTDVPGDFWRPRGGAPAAALPFQGHQKGGKRERKAFPGRAPGCVA